MTARLIAPQYSIRSTCSPEQLRRRKISRLSVAYQPLWDRRMTSKLIAPPGFHH
jgi:hypothetical protein